MAEQLEYAFSIEQIKGAFDTAMALVDVAESYIASRAKFDAAGNPEITPPVGSHYPATAQQEAVAFHRLVHELTDLKITDAESAQRVRDRLAVDLAFAQQRA